MAASGVRISCDTHAITSFLVCCRSCWRVMSESDATIPSTGLFQCRRAGDCLLHPAARSTSGEDEADLEPNGCPYYANPKCFEGASFQRYRELEQQRREPLPTKNGGLGHSNKRSWTTPMPAMRTKNGLGRFSAWRKPNGNAIANPASPHLLF